MDLRPSFSDWLPLVTASAARVRAAATAGHLDPDLLTSLADVQAMFAHDLRPRPLATLAYLEQARDDVIAHVRRIRQYDPARIVHIRSEDGWDYAMTPRKALRRELDHVLDHLNQVEQWLAWQQAGIVPTPTDGWAPSDPMLSDDLLPIAEDEHAAWLWRLDMGWHLLIQRVGQLSDAQQLVSPARRPRLRRLLNRSADAIHGYVVGSLAISLMAGGAAFVALAVLRVPYALALALVVARFDVLPLFGAFH